MVKVPVLTGITIEKKVAMFNLRSILISGMALAALLFSLVRPTAVYAEGGVPLTASDPYFTVAGALYTFSAGDCDPLSSGAQACPNPIQASVNFLDGTVASSPWFGAGAAPDDGNIYVEAGTYTEDVAINGLTGWNSGANTPAYLGIIGAGSGSTTLDGAFVITDMNGFTLSGFAVQDADASGNVASISTHDNTGTLELSDIVVVSVDPGVNPTDHIGDGIYVIDHAGDILLTGVDSSNNSETGAWLDNRAGTGSVSIDSSTFNSNGSIGFTVQSNGNINLMTVVGNGNLRGNSVDNCNATGLACIGTGNISVSSSVFNNNGVPDVITPHARGLVASSNGDIHLSNVTANSNNDNGALLINYFEGSTGDVLVESSQFNENGQGELGDGLGILSRGGISLVNITTELNLEHGVQAFNRADGSIANVSVQMGQFNDNGMAGLQLGSNGEINVSDSSIHGNSTLWGTSSGIEAYAEFGGNIILSNVISDDNHGGGAKLDNRAGTGTISVESSEFNRNDSCGLCTYSNGDISFIGVTASYNESSGANANNCNAVGLTCAGTGGIFVSSSAFNNNGPVGVPIPHWVGFVAESNGDITLSKVSASSNNYHGAVVFNYFDGSTGSIVVELGEFNDNGQGGELGDGLKPQSRGDITLLDVTTSGNLEKGVEAASGFGGGTGAISVEGGEFNDNGLAGLELGSFHSDVNLSGASIKNNVLLGANLVSPVSVTVGCSTFSNHPTGILGQTPLLTLNGVGFFGNTLDYTNTGLVVINSDCDPASTASGDVHGQGSPLNGSLHANCRAAKGEVDPFCIDE